MAKSRVIPTSAPEISAAQQQARESNRSIFTEAWNQARAAAAKYGGKASQYFQIRGANVVRESYDERKKLADEIVVDPSKLPAVPYGFLKARAHRLVAASGSDKFWVLNKGGRAGWDGLDIADYLNWTDGSDVSVGEAITADLTIFLPSSMDYDLELERVVYSDKLARFLQLGGQYADISVG